MSSTEHTETTRAGVSTLSLATLLCAQAIAKMDAGDVASQIDTIFTKVHEQIVRGAQEAVVVEGAVLPIEVAGLAPPTPGSTSQDPDMEPIQRLEAPSLRGSTVQAGSAWKGLPEAKQKLFASLAEKHNLRFRADGFPIPNTPDGTIGGEDTMFDPMTGQRLNMLKRRLQVYDLTPEDGLAMFGLPADQPLVSRHYSERKRVENLKENRQVVRAKRPPAWRTVSPAVRRRYMDLIAQFDLKIGPDGYPIPNTPDGTLGGTETMYDPMTGESLSMLKRRMKQVYNLSPEETNVMFGLPAETPLVSQDYSGRKRAEIKATTTVQSEVDQSDRRGEKTSSGSRANRKVRETV